MLSLSTRQQGNTLYTSHFISVCLSQSECPEKRGPNSEGTVQKQESRWIQRRVFQVPADHVTHSPGGMQPIVSTGGGGGGWREAEDSIYVNALKARSSRSPRALCRDFSRTNSDREQSYLCPPCGALISPSSCRLERSRPLPSVVRNSQSPQADSQTPWLPDRRPRRWKDLLRILREISTGYELDPLMAERLIAIKIPQQMKADGTDRLKTQSVSDSDPSILSHGVDCGELLCQWAP